MPKKYKVEVIADNSGKWAGNQLEFNSMAEAEDYAKSLAWRWTAVREWRVVAVKEEAVHVCSVDVPGTCYVCGVRDAKQVLDGRDVCSPCWFRIMGEREGLKVGVGG